MTSKSASDLALLGGKPVLGPESHTLWPILGEAERQGVAAVLERRILSGSFAPEARAFEAELAAAVGARFALLTHSGTSALQVALQAAGVGEGDEVIVPAYTFVATALAVVQQGGIPIFCDVHEDTGLIDPSLVEELISPRTKALMPVHVHGCPADLEALGALCKRRGLALVEDAAQAHLATYQGKPVGALYQGGGFSLQSSKNLSAGEGGVFVTNDERAYEAANRARNFGQDLNAGDRTAYDLRAPLDGHRALASGAVGSMYRGNELMAAIARAQLKALPERTRRCQENAALLSRRLAELPGVLPPVVPADRQSVHHKLRVQLDLERAGLAKTSMAAFREKLIEALRAEGLKVVQWQSDPIPAQPLFQELRGYGQGFPFARADRARLQENYRPERYAATRRMLDRSFLLFSQSHPLIAQPREVVEAYAEAFAKVWAQRQALAQRA